MGDQPTLPTSVDITQLDQAVGWLEELQRFVETYCYGAMPDIQKALSAAADADTSDVDFKLNGDATVFGGFYSAYGIQAKHDAAYKAVRETLKNVAQHLGKAADATKKIADNYETAEERNRAGAADIQRLLEAGSYTAKDDDAIYKGKDTDASTGYDGGHYTVPVEKPTILAPGPSGPGGPKNPSGTTAV